MERNQRGLIAGPLAILFALVLSLPVGLEAIQLRPGAPGGISLADPAMASVGSSEGALFLLIPVGARAVGLGRAMTAMSGPESAFWNPAGLAREEGRRLLVYRGGDDVIAESTALSFLIGQSRLGTIGLSYQLLDFGDQDLTGPNGEILGTLGFRNHLGIISAATAFAENFAFGVNLKLVQHRESCRGQCSTGGVTATTFAIDMGFQSTPVAQLPIRFAAMVAHLGSGLRVGNAEQVDPLPTRVRMSVAYDLLDRWREDDELQLWTIVEVEGRWSDLDGDPSVYLGTEFSIGRSEAVYARAGYVLGDLNQNDGAAVGFGLRFERFELALGKSLAASPLAVDAEPVHVSFGFRF